MNKSATNINNKRNNQIATVTLMIIFALFCNVSGYAQNKNNTQILDSTNAEQKSIVKEEASANYSNLEFVLWFMGSKQDPNTTISSDANNPKKQVITSGMAPNRLLIKAFLKKTINLESTIA